MLPVPTIPRSLCLGVPQYGRGPAVGRSGLQRGMDALVRDQQEGVPESIRPLGRDNRGARRVVLQSLDPNNHRHIDGRRLGDEG